MKNLFKREKLLILSAVISMLVLVSCGENKKSEATDSTTKTDSTIKGGAPAGAKLLDDKLYELYTSAANFSNIPKRPKQKLIFNYIIKTNTAAIKYLTLDGWRYPENGKKPNSNVAPTMTLIAGEVSTVELLSDYSLADLVLKNAGIDSIQSHITRYSYSTIILKPEKKTTGIGFVWKVYGSQNSAPPFFASPAIQAKSQINTIEANPAPPRDFDTGAL